MNLRLGDCENFDFHKGSFTTIDETLILFCVDHSKKENQSGLPRSSLGELSMVYGEAKAFTLKELEYMERHQLTVTQKYGKLMVLGHTDTGHSLIDSIEADSCLSENWRTIRNGTFSLSFVRSEKWANRWSLKFCSLLKGKKCALNCKSGIEEISQRSWSSRRPATRCACKGETIFLT